MSTKNIRYELDFEMLVTRYSEDALLHHISPEPREH